MEQQIHVELLKDILSYRRLRRWNLEYHRKADSTVTAAQLAALADDWGNMSEGFQNALIKHGLGQPFSAELVTAFALQQAGGQVGKDSKPSASTTGQAAGAAGLVAWQSLHFFADPNRPVDVDLAGRFGFAPVLAIAQPTSGESAVATYQSAFVWDVAAEPNWRVADLAELTTFVRFGQTILNSTQTLLQNGTSGTVAVVADNATRAELFYEAGVSFSIYGQSLEILHLKKGMLSPMFSLGGGFRHDNRFSRAGVLADFDKPEERLFLRFMVDALQLANKAQADEPFTVGVSVDFDTAMHRGGWHVPSGTRIESRRSQFRSHTGRQMKVT